MTRLNLACGPHKIAGFENLDKPDWRFQDGLHQYEDASVEGITLSHGLLYLPLSQWPAFFAELARVLEPGGVLRVTEDSTLDPLSPRYGGFHDAVTLTDPALVVTMMQSVGLDASEVRALSTHFKDMSLCQAWHGTEPKVFFVEGVKT